MRSGGAGDVPEQLTSPGALRQRRYRERHRDMLEQRPKRAQIRKKRPTTVDRRLRISQRMAELRALFLSTLESAGVPLTPMRQMLLEEAVQLKALAEKARGDYLRGGARPSGRPASGQTRKAAASVAGASVEGCQRPSLDDAKADAAVTLNDVVRIERKADAAVRAIGLPSDKPRDAAPASAPPAPTSAPDLTQLSDAQLDRLYGLLTGRWPAPKENGADG